MSHKHHFSDYTQSDIRKAEQIFAEQRKSIEPLPAIKDDCIISILVPVYNESLSRIKKQIRSFNSQTLEKDLYELVFIVNNPPIKKTDRSALKQNSLVIKYLSNISHKNIHVIDRSSKGRELTFGNIGEARNIGLLSISKRYFDQKRDGIIIHTDADTFPKDDQYLAKVKRAFDIPKVYGAAGGIRFVLSLDNNTKKNRGFFEAHLSVFHKYVRWNFLLSALETDVSRLKFEPTTFSGAHMISRAIASICVGGIKQVNRTEDYLFGVSLLEFAKKHHGKILSMRDKWIMITSLRESTRSGTSFGPIFNNIKETNGKPLVRDTATPFFPVFAKRLLIKMAKLPNNQQMITANHFFDISLKISKEELLAIKKLISQLKKIEDTNKYYVIYEEIRAKDTHTILHKFFNRLYKLMYPKIQLNDNALADLQKKVFAHPKRKAYALNAIKYYGTYYLD
ncbi:glycosyltransferase family 2 protein [Candidatus Saccharibacteria bacterium]|nr:glycosyltransferase family 2 protein [Candidatus Saccharibacteria bacterium]